jgi:hypothetical protein
MRRLFRRMFEQVNIIYLLAHLVLLIAGLLIFQVSKSLLWQSAGASLVAAAVTGWVVFVYVLTGETTRDRLGVVQRLGVIAGFTHRGPAIREEYRTRIVSARRQIDVLGFGLSSLREDFEGEFANWKQRASVRVLLLDPDFPTANCTYANQRDREEQNPEPSVANEVRHFINRTRDLVDDRFQVRLYRCLPAVNVFRVDDELFWGPYLMGRQSRNSPTLVVRASGELFQMFTDHFDTIWRDHSHEPHANGAS